MSYRVSFYTGLEMDLARSFLADEVRITRNRLDVYQIGSDGELRKVFSFVLRNLTNAQHLDIVCFPTVEPAPFVVWDHCPAKRGPATIAYLLRASRFRVSYFWYDDSASTPFFVSRYHILRNFLDGEFLLLPRTPSVESW